MTKAEFIEKIENGRDILFDINGRHFGIFTWPQEGIGVGEASQDTTKDPLQYFDTSEALFDGFMIDGVPLADLCDKVVITDYS